jgi:Raf kinase inhibitor-like YbhB/YbcL family protein
MGAKGIGVGGLLLLALVEPGTSAVAFELRSPAFAANETIPRKYTCDGPDLSPSLRWTAPPGATKSLALIADDPDAPGGTWVHWVIYAIPAETRELPEGVKKVGRLPSGARQGRNDFGKLGYGGPCPPKGPAHRYIFALYALDAALSLKPGGTKPDLLKAMEGHVLGKAELIGRYGR